MGRYNKGASTNLIHIFSDCILGVVAFITAMWLSNLDFASDIHSYIVPCTTFMIIYILASKESRLYNVTIFFYVDRIIRYVIKSFLIAAGVTSTFLIYVSDMVDERNFYVVFFIVSFLLLLSSAFISRYLMKHIHRLAPRTFLIGDIDGFGKFNRFLDRSNLDVNIIGYISMQKTTDSRYVGSIDDLEGLIHKNGIDQIYIMNNCKDTIDIQPCINMCMEMGVTVRIVMNTYKAGAAQSYVSSVGTYPVLTYHRVSLNTSSRAVKRLVDIVGSIIGILLASPFMMLVAIAIKIDSKGPIIFKQKRIGLNGRQFYMYKFRSMCIDAEERKKQLLRQNEVESGLMFKIKDDPRITRVGRFIRKTSLDELPQFYNVLLGNMSLVGTRPPTLDEVERYERSHWRRMSIKPGITGMWQVSGRSAITDFDEIVELDTEYIDKWNVLMDFRIMIKTVLQMFVRKGAY